MENIPQLHIVHSQLCLNQLLNCCSNLETSLWGQQDLLEQPSRKTLKAVVDPQVRQNIAGKLPLGKPTIPEKAGESFPRPEEKSQTESPPSFFLNKKSLLTLAKLVQTLQVQQKERENDPHPTPNSSHLGECDRQATTKSVSTADQTHQPIPESSPTSANKGGAR